jgi:hypothetical protein
MQPLPPRLVNIADGTAIRCSRGYKPRPRAAWPVRQLRKIPDSLHRVRGAAWPYRERISAGSAAELGLAARCAAPDGLAAEANATRRSISPRGLPSPGVPGALTLDWSASTNQRLARTARACEFIARRVAVAARCKCRGIAILPARRLRCTLGRHHLGGSRASCGLMEAEAETSVERSFARPDLALTRESRGNAHPDHDARAVANHGEG